MGPDAMILMFQMLSFKPTVSLYSFTFIKSIFSSSSLSAIRVVSSAYLRLLIFLPAILIPACVSSSLAFHMMYSPPTFLYPKIEYIPNLGLESLVLSLKHANLGFALSLWLHLQTNHPSDPDQVFLLLFGFGQLTTFNVYQWESFPKTAVSSWMLKSALLHNTRILTPLAF